MRPAKAVKLGEEFLKGISEGELVSMQVMEKDYKVKTMLQAARHRKKGMLLREISEAIGKAVSTVHGWLLRLEERMERRYDRKSPGRPCRLSDAQRSVLDRDIEKNPEESGFRRSTWTAKLVVRYILERFGVRYSADGALRLTDRLNFSVRKARPVPYNSATKEETEKYVKDTIKEIEAHTERGYKVVCLDATALIDSPLSRRGIRRRGGHDTVKINHSKKSIKIIGALGRNTLDIQFHENLATGNIIELLEELRQKYVNVFVIMDNAAAHKSRDMEAYIRGTNGSVARWFLPPHTPQHNPIEILWREIKRAIADTFFGGFDRLQERIRNILDSGEVPRTRLFRYMLDAMGCQKGPEETGSAPARHHDSLPEPTPT